MYAVFECARGVCYIDSLPNPVSNGQVDSIYMSVRSALNASVAHEVNAWRQITCRYRDNVNPDSGRVRLSGLTYRR